MERGRLVDWRRRVRRIVVERAGVEDESPIGLCVPTEFFSKVVDSVAVFDGVEGAGGVDEEVAEEVLDESVAVGGEAISLRLKGEFDWWWKGCQWTQKIGIVRLLTLLGRKSREREQHLFLNRRERISRFCGEQTERPNG
jgi:hypothetical protein